jgi:hypothetical protein
LRLTGSAEPTVVVLGPSGDRVAYVRVEKPSGAVTLRQAATVARRELAVDPATAARSGEVDRTVFAQELAPSRFVVVNDEVRATRRARSPRHGTVMKARALYDHP